jgi:hypothetical protein
LTRGLVVRGRDRAAGPDPLPRPARPGRRARRTRRSGRGRGRARRDRMRARGRRGRVRAGRWRGRRAERGDREHRAGDQADGENARQQRQDGPLPGERRGEPAQPAAPAPRAQLPVVGEHVTVELARVIRDVDVDRGLIPPACAARIHRHLRARIGSSVPIMVCPGIPRRPRRQDASIGRRPDLFGSLG